MNRNNLYKDFLNPALISKLNSLELKAKNVVEGFMIGLHRSPYHGFSVEFSEHRSYMQGDPIRNIDWKVYGKTEKYFIKQFEEETNLNCHIILDVSASMNFKYKSVLSKIEYGKILAASLAYIMIKQQDAVGLSIYSDHIHNYFSPKTSKIHLMKITKEMASCEISGKTSTSLALNELAEKINKRGLIIIISDLLDEIDSIIKALKHFLFKKNEIIVFQILDPVEESFAFGADAIFKDSETGEEISTLPFQIQKSYSESMRVFKDKIKYECQSRGIEYNLLTTQDYFDKALFSYFRKRSKLY